jgi:quinol monooxygenase YgiN
MKGPKASLKEKPIPMIIFTLSFMVSSSKRKDVISLFDSLVGPLSVKPGCIRVALLSDVNVHEDLLLLEEWQSRTDLEKHIRSDEFRKILAVMDLADESPKTRFYHVSSTEGFEVIEKARDKTVNMSHDP